MKNNRTNRTPGTKRRKISLIVLIIILLLSIGFFLSREFTKEKPVLLTEAEEKETAPAPSVREPVRPPDKPEGQTAEKQPELTPEGEAKFPEKEDIAAPVISVPEPAKKIPDKPPLIEPAQPVPLPKDVTTPEPKIVKPAKELAPPIAKDITKKQIPSVMPEKGAAVAPSVQEPVRQPDVSIKEAAEKQPEVVQEAAKVPEKKDITAPAVSAAVPVTGAAVAPSVQEPVSPPDVSIKETLEKGPEAVHEAARVPEQKDISAPAVSAPEPFMAAPTVQVKEFRKEKYVAGPADIAFLPFDNFSTDAKAGDKVMAAIKAKMHEKGLRVLDERAVSDLLCREKVRSAGYVSREIARKLRDEYQVQSILAGSVISFSSGDGAHIGLVARLIDTTSGIIVWADYAFVIGDDITSILGLGRIRSAEKLVPKAINRLLSSFRVSPLKREKETTYRVAVIPFQNNSGFEGAGMVAMYMFLGELLRQSPFEPIEFGDVRKTIVELQVRSNGELDYQRLEKLSKALDADTVLVGIVERYPSGSDTSNVSVISMTARLLDARNNKILWYNTFRLNSEKNVIAFEWGEREPADKVAYNGVASMVKKMKTALSQ